METHNIIARQQAEIDAANLKLIAAEAEIARLNAVIESRHAVVGALMGDVVRAEMGGEADIRSAALEAIFESWDGCLYDSIDIGAALRADFGKIGPVAVPAVEVQGVAVPEGLIALLQSIKPKYGDVGSRDDEVAAKRKRIEDAIEMLLGLAAIPSVAAPVEAHLDDLAVDRFAKVMKEKLAKKRGEGRGGWEGATCDDSYLADQLFRHAQKGDPVDVANFAMMLHQRNVDAALDIDKCVLRIAALDFAKRVASMWIPEAVPPLPAPSKAAEAGSIGDDPVFRALTERLIGGEVCPARLDLIAYIDHYAACAAGAKAEYETTELSKEVARLQNALCFWLPSVTDREDEVAIRILEDAFLLVGCDGNMPQDFKSAQELGWVALIDQRPRKAAVGALTDWISVEDQLPPVGQLVMVFAPPTKHDWPDSLRVTFDCIDPDADEPTSWLNHNEHYEHFCCVAKPEGSIGPSAEAPYTHWMPLPEAPAITAQVSGQSGAAESAGGGA